MRHAEIELELHQGRAELLQLLATLTTDQAAMPLTTSEHDPGARWSLLDHAVHVAGFEGLFGQIARRRLENHPNPLGPVIGDDGKIASREQAIVAVNRLNEEYVRAHRGSSIEAVIDLGLQSRLETLSLLKELSANDLGLSVPGAPWGDGTIGGILAASTDHGRMHWKLFGGAFEA